MQSNRQKGRPKLRLTVKLDLVEDADIITWLESLPLGERSHAVRSVLRGVLQGHSQPDLEGIRAVVAEELGKALSGRQVLTGDPEPDIRDIDVERKYGDRLDEMLGGLQSGLPGDGDTHQ